MNTKIDDLKFGELSLPVKESEIVLDRPKGGDLPGNPKFTRRYCTIADEITLDDGGGNIITRLSGICVIYDEYVIVHGGDNYQHVVEAFVSYTQKENAKHFSNGNRNFIELTTQFFQRGHFPNNPLKLVNSGSPLRLCGKQLCKDQAKTYIDGNLDILPNADDRAYLNIKYYYPSDQC